MSEGTGKVTGLPENAQRELKPGETYVPIVSWESGIREVSKRTIVFGLSMLALFAGAATYIALKLGQGIETAIPIAVLAVGFSAVMLRKSTLLENVNILAIGSTSGIVVGGSVFVMPAIFMLGLDEKFGWWGTFLTIFLVPFLGSVLGVLFLIPFRDYFTRQMHGKLPFPEATASAEILVTGEGGGSKAKVLVYWLGLGVVLDYMALALQAWSDTFTTAAISACSTLTDKFKAVFSMNTSTAVLGLGVIIGVRYAAIIMAGSMLVYFVVIPLAAYLSPEWASHPFDEIFSGYENDGGNKVYGMRSIGIGGIFAAGIISIIKMSPIIKQAVQKVLSQLSTGHSDVGASRLNRDIKMSAVFILAVVLAMAIFLYFRFVVLCDEKSATLVSLLSVVLVFVVSFLFSAVSAWAIAMISVTPISGMTLTTLIISAGVLAAMGLKGESGMFAILLIGGVVCTALSMSGSLVTQFKIGQWLGSTPRSIQWSNILASAAASLGVTAVIMLFAHVYGYGTPTEVHPDPLPAPQASAMAAVASALLGGQGAPWVLYALGAVVSVIATMLGISALAFALGMYLPMELNSPILLGACIGWLIQHSTKDAMLSKARGDRAILIASGLIAGGALAGVLDGVTKMADVKWSFGLADDVRNWLGLGVFLALAVFLYWDSRRAKVEQNATS